MSYTINTILNRWLEIIIIKNQYNQLFRQAKDKTTIKIIQNKRTLQGEKGWK